MLRAVRESKHMKLSRKIRNEIQETEAKDKESILSIEIRFFSYRFEKSSLFQTNVMHDLKKYFDIQFAFTESEHQTESPVELCKLLLDMIDSDKHENAKLLNRSLCTLLSSCTSSFLNSQINDAAFMLQRFCEKFLVDPERAKDSKIAEAATKLESVKTFEEIVIDIMRFEKIYTELLFH